MSRSIVARIEREAGAPGLLNCLSERLPASDVQSLLLETFHLRSSRVTTSDIMSRGEAELCRPCDLDARLFGLFDAAAFGSAKRFAAVDLSPVSPLGTNAVLGGIHQNNVLSTVRNTEVLGDSTPALALECARRRTSTLTRRDATRLCASHRLIRLQRFDVPGFTPHFRLFTMVTAGRDTGNSTFECTHLREHIEVYLDLFRGLNEQGFSLMKPLVEVSDVALSESMLAERGVSREQVRASVRAHIAGGSERLLRETGVTLPDCVRDPAAELPTSGAARLVEVNKRVLDSIRSAYPEADVRINLARLEGMGYYTGLCLRISPTAPDGVRYPIVDGGFTDWTARLLQDKKERLLTTGIGSEFACRRYRMP